MYCEARTKSGLICSDIGLDQCDKCRDKPTPKVEIIWRSNGLHWCEFEYNSNTQLPDIYDARYAFGLDEPRYPVPAIQYMIDIGEDFQTILERGRNVSDGYTVHPHIYPTWNVYDEEKIEAYERHWLNSY